MASPLLTDLYELNMAASYLTRGMDGLATYSLFVRNLPENRGFLIAAGLEGCLDWLEQLHFDEHDVAELAALGFTPPQLEALAGLHFTGEVWGVPEGSVVFADEPLLEVTAPIAEAQLIETYLLNQVTYQTSVATKAARCRLAGADIELVEFGMRRAHGVDASVLAARSSVIAGFSSTSNVEAALRLGVRAAGTMAHSYIEAFPEEGAAFRAFAEDFPGRPTFLVDTYDIPGGVAEAIAVINEHGLAARAAIRIDSGELTEVTRAARSQLDAAGLGSVRIMVSGAIDEYGVAELVASGAPVDAIGIGTRLVTVADAPFLDSVYKLVEFENQPVAKLSPGKITLPGAKQVFRREGFDDTLALRAEPAPEDSQPLLEAVMRGGRRLPTGDTPALTQATERCQAGLATLPEELRHLEHPAHREVARSATLQVAAAELYRTLAERVVP